MEFHEVDFGAGALSEGAVFGLGGGLGFLYVEVPDHKPPIYLVGRGADMERDIAQHLEIPLEVRASDDAEEGWRWVREELDGGRPPMVWADIGHLEYLRVKMHNTRHDIVVVDYDEAEGITWIADNDRDELQPCSLDSLARARSSDAFPGPARHTTFLYDWRRGVADPRSAVKAAIRRAVDNMRAGGAINPWPGGAFGLAGVELFADSYPRWPDIFEENLPDALRALDVFIVKAGTGGAMFRSLQATFLREMALLLDDLALSALGHLYGALASLWRTLAGCARVEDHARGLSTVEEINRLEHLGVSLQENWLAKESR